MFMVFVFIMRSSSEKLSFKAEGLVEWHFKLVFFNSTHTRVKDVAEYKIKSHFCFIERPWNEARPQNNICCTIEYFTSAYLMQF